MKSLLACVHIQFHGIQAGRYWGHMNSETLMPSISLQLCNAMEREQRCL